MRFRYSGALVVLMLGPTLVLSAQESSHWRLEGKAGAEVAQGQTAQGQLAFKVEPQNLGGAIRFSGEVPAPFVYDPLTGRSIRNTTSLQLKSAQQKWSLLQSNASPLKEGESFTLEAFASPTEDARRDLFVAGMFRQGRQGSEAAVGIRWLNNFGQSYWGGLVASSGGPRRHWSAGHYVTISRLTAESLGWRHIALVYDAEKKRATCYLDYWLVASQPVDGVLSWEGVPFCIGGSPSGGGFQGLIDEVRLTRGALPPGKFLRAVAQPTEKVDFTSPETLLPRGTRYIDFREAFGARGDGKTDDTDAFEKAFAVLSNKVPGAYYTLYLAPGTYLISRPLWCSRFFILQGSGRDRTILRLRDQSKEFQDSNKPEPVLRASSTRGAPGSNQGVNGSSIGIYIHDLTIDTGTGNPGAKALEYHSNNHGALERVNLLSGDGKGVVGLDLTHKTNGPALIKDVKIVGFRRGITSKYAEYSMTLEGITLQNQTEVGVLNEGNILAIRRLHSTNKVPAVVSKSNWSMVSLLDSQLLGGSADQPAIVAEGALYARNIQVQGYQDSIRRPRDGKEDAKPIRGDVKEFVGDQVVTVGQSPKSSLNLPIEETPEVPWGDIHKDWISIESFAEKKQGDDWAPALEAALASGAKTIYFPQGGYEFGRPVRVKGEVMRLFGMRASLRRPQGATGNDPVLIYDDPNPAKTLVIERIDLADLEHRSPGTLVIKHGTPERYTTTAGCGKLFLENTAGTDWHFDHPQQIWVRQWNPEAHGPGPNIISKGATIWSLGFKTEYESSKLWASDGARTEILGGFIYPVKQGIPRDRPIFKNVDSSLSAIYGMSAYVAMHDLQVLDVQNGETVETRGSNLVRFGARFRMDLYSSVSGK